MSRKSRRVGFAFSGVRTAGGAGTHAVVQMLAAADTEIDVTMFLNSGSSSKLVLSSSSLIESSEAPIVGASVFAPPGYALKATLTKGLTSTPPPTDAFEIGFDVHQPNMPVTVRAGEYLAQIRTSANANLTAGWIAEERSTKFMGFA